MTEQDRAIMQSALVGDMSILTIPNLELVRDQNGNTPFHLLTTVVTQEFIGNNHLFFLNLNKTVRNNSGDTPLHLLAYKRREWILGYVDDALALRNNNGFTPIHILAQLGVENVRLHKYSTTILDNAGRTAVSYLPSSKV